MSVKKPRRRSDCPISFALEIFGDRWTILVLRDLMLMGKPRFRDLQAADEGIASNILADRLKRLERRGLIIRERHRHDRRQYVYMPTEAGINLIPMLVEMAVWGAKNDPKSRVDPDFIKRFETDRDGLVASMIEGARRRIAKGDA